MKKRPADPPLDSQSTMEETADSSPESGGGAMFPIVGVGASAGGLEAFTQLLKALPADTGMAFVLVQHLAPTHASALKEILSRATTMPVVEAEDDLPVEPNHVYVIPPDRGMVIAGGVLQLLPRESGPHRPVDQFFRALAHDRRHQALGVVLSGTATDGTLGLEAIKGEGGITFAQDETAQHDGMPHSAVASGCVDFMLPPDEIGKELVRISQHPHSAPSAKVLGTDDAASLGQVVQLLHHATGVDFSHYKFNTLFRRITRRMMFHKLETLPEYVQYLRETSTEADALFQDILISVTSFFRDAESFEALKRSVFPGLLKDRSRHDPVRIWALGCSTGQEAYSLAMAYVEAAEAAGSAVPLQLFATDLNPGCIEKARAGVYPKDIAQDVSAERLRRFFTEGDGHYRISKAIRDCCVFSRHNVLSDAPFSRIDLVSCRNLLIYMGPLLQQQIMPTLHYSLKPDGVLWLGASETIGTYRNLFGAQDAKHKIYVKKPGAGSLQARLLLQHAAAPSNPIRVSPTAPRAGADLHREADYVLSTKFAPPGVLVSSDLDILQYRGDTAPYLAPTPGRASLNLLKMLREGLLVPVRAAVVRAREEGAPVREEGLRVEFNGATQEVAVEVIPIKGSGGIDSGFLVLFEDTSRIGRAGSGPATDASRGGAGPANASGTPESEQARLTHELAATREYLQSLIEQQEAANEELQSATEEVQSANEELQSTNEELETSKEEIQSSNEELVTVNDELGNRNTELNRVNNDLVNLIGSVQMPIVMLGPDLRIRRFTPTAEKLLNLTSADLGRPLTDIRFNLMDLPELGPLLVEVLETVRPHEFDVHDGRGRWYSLRLRPYKTHENKIDGVVVMLVEMTDRKRAEAAVDAKNVRLHLLWEAAAVLLSSDDPDRLLWDLLPKIGPALGVDVYLNYMVDELGGALRLISSVGISDAWVQSIERADFDQHICGMVALRRKSIVTTHIQQSDDPKVQLFKSFGLRAYVCNPLMVEDHLLGTLSFGSRSKDGFEPDDLAVLDTISHYLAIAHERGRLLNKLREADQHKNEFLAMLAHELRNPLATICNAMELMALNDRKGEAVTSSVEMMERQVRQIVRLVDDLLDLSRVSRGKIDLRREPMELAPALKRAAEAARMLFKDRAHQVTVSVPPAPLFVEADPARIDQVLDNLMNNACRFTDKGGRVSLTLERAATQAVIRVRDTGIGLAADQLPRVFEMFMQVDTSLGRPVSGLGLGLTLAKNLVEIHGGTLEVHSAGLGQGSEFVVRLPMVAEKPDSSLPGPTLSGRLSGRARRFLVVDDNLDAALSLAMLLEHGGSETRTAHDGLEAVELADSFRPDVVLLDIGLPKLNGYEAARKIREQPWGKAMLLVALTGWNQEQTQQKSAEAGFDHHLIKPVSAAALTKLLAEAPAAARGAPSAD